MTATVTAARITEICAELNANPMMDLNSPASAGHDWAATVEAIAEYDAANVAALRAYGSPCFALTDGTVIMCGGTGWHVG